MKDIYGQRAEHSNNMVNIRTLCGEIRTTYWMYGNKCGIFIELTHLHGYIYNMITESPQSNCRINYWNCDSALLDIYTSVITEERLYYHYRTTHSRQTKEGSELYKTSRYTAQSDSNNSAANKQIHCHTLLPTRTNHTATNTRCAKIDTQRLSLLQTKYRTSHYHICLACKSLGCSPVLPLSLRRIAANTNSLLEQVRAKQQTDRPRSVGNNCLTGSRRLCRAENIPQWPGGGPVSPPALVTLQLPRKLSFYFCLSARARVMLPGTEEPPTVWEKKNPARTYNTSTFPLSRSLS